MSEKTELTKKEIIIKADFPDRRTTLNQGLTIGMHSFLIANVEYGAESLDTQQLVYKGKKYDIEVSIKVTEI